MTGKTETPDAERQLREEINRDGLLDLFVGATLVLTVGLAALGWLVMGDPGVVVGIGPLLPAFFFKPARNRYTYPRLGCGGYRPAREMRFALIALTVTSVLGLIVFLLTALAGIHVVNPFFEHAPVWAALLGVVASVLLAWWHRSKRFYAYVAVAAIALVAGYLLAPRMPERLAILLGAVGAAMVVVGTVLAFRFRRMLPRAVVGARPAAS